MTTKPEDTPIVRKDGSHLVACFPEKYDDLLGEKVSKFRELLGDLVSNDIKDAMQIFESPRDHYRMRANFTTWRDVKGDPDPMGIYYAMFGEGAKHDAYEIKAFPRGNERINSLMENLLEAIRKSTYLHVALFEVRFVTTMTGAAEIVLIYKIPIQEGWKEEAEALSKNLNATVIGRSRKVKLIIGGDEHIEEKYSVRGRDVYLYQTEGAFSQPNAKVCEKMLEWSMSVTEGSTESDLLELYCGGGTFTLALAPNFRTVLATEISKASVELAQLAIAKNDISNIKIARLSAEEFTQAYNGERQFQRLQDAGIDMKSFDIRTVLVDPPRAGLDSATCALLCRFDKIVYISCNPETLARDVKVMSATHDIVKTAAFDQFPYTHHLEVGVLLVKRKDDEAGSNERDDAPLGKRRRSDSIADGVNQSES
jgi:tRNA (uracil-5-)-methyltransferase